MTPVMRIRNFAVAILAGVTIVGGIIATVVLLGGCSVRQAQVGVRTGLVSADEALASADRIMAGPAQDASAEVLATIEAECPTPCPDAVAQYREAMADWYAVAQALRASHEALLALDTGVDVWVATGNLPGSWSQVCEAGTEALEDLLTAVVAATGTEVPTALIGAPAALGAVCRDAESFPPGDE